MVEAQAQIEAGAYYCRQQSAALTRRGGDVVGTITQRDANGFVVGIRQPKATGSAAQAPDGSLAAALTNQATQATSNDARYDRTFVNDASGTTVFVSQGGFNAQGEVNSSIANPASGYQGGVTGSSLTPGHVQRQLVANGEVLARYGDAPTTEQSTKPTNNPVYVDTADFRLQAPAMKLKNQGLDPVAYTVVGGETLKDIARNVLGDASLWWRIAEANSLAVSGDGQLTAGQTLTVPKLSLNANSVDTFQPYDPSQAMGSMDPVLPVPEGNKGGCGGIGAIIMVVVAVVVSIYTAGLLSGAAVNVMQAGISVLSGGTLGAGAAGIAGMSQLGVVGAAMTAGAVGSVASQAVGNLIGAQDGFSWKGVALSALGSGVGSALGLSGALPQLGSQFADAALRQAVSGTISQGIGTVTGLQSHFDWKSVAAGAVGAGVGASVGQVLQSGNVFGGFESDFATGLARGTVSGFAGGLTTAVLKGGRVSVQQVATDAFGNALANSLAGVGSSGSYRGQGSASSPYVDPDTGEHIVFGKPFEPNFPQMQQFVGAFGDGSTPPVDRSNDVLLAAGDGFTMGRGPVSIGQRGRTVYIAEQGADPSIDALLAKAQADMKDLERLRDEEITAALNRNSVIRETVTPIFEPFTIEVPTTVRAIAGGVGDVVTGTISGLADLTVGPVADLAQTGLKALHGAVTGDYQPLTPLSSYADSVVNGGMGTWEGIKATGMNVFNVSPLGMVYHAGTGAYGVTTAAINGDVRGVTRESLGFGLNFAGAAVVPVGMMRTPVTPGFLVQAETSALQRMAANNRAPAPWADLRRAYQQARRQVDFAHIEADVAFKANGKVDAKGGHFSTSPQLQRIPGTEAVSPNGVIYGQINLLGPDGNFYLKTNNKGFSTMTPDTWSLARSKGEMSQAFLNRSIDPSGKWSGTSSGVDFRFNPPNNKVPMWRGFPLP